MWDLVSFSICIVLPVLADCSILCSIYMILGWLLMPCQQYQLNISSIDGNKFLHLVGDKAPSAGRVVVHYGLLGTVCFDYSFNMFEADVVCRELGYREATRYGAADGRIYAPKWLANLGCTNESSLRDCPNDGIGNTYHCIFDSDAEVVCQGTVVIA